MNDYAEALSEYPEFIVYLVCKNLWENDESLFFPKIKPIKNACKDVMSAFLSASKKNDEKEEKKEISVEIGWRELPREKWLDSHWENYIAEADHMEKTNREHGREVSANEWKIEAEKRRSEKGVTMAG